MINQRGNYDNLSAYMESEEVALVGGYLQDDFQKDGNLYFGRWSCGNSKNIRPDDRVFMIRLGKDPRGIMASGRADSEVYKDRHWDEELAAGGKTTFYIGVRLDTFRTFSDQVKTMVGFLSCCFR